MTDFAVILCYAVGETDYVQLHLVHQNAPKPIEIIYFYCSH